MMYDPYAILGVKYDATDDEIKKAYRQKSRLYHPDANINNPNKAQAEEKFKQVQQAYDQIMKDRERGARDAYSSGSQYGPGSSYYSGGSPYGNQQQYDGDASNSYGNDYRDPFGGNGFFYGPFGFGFNFGGYQQQQREAQRDPRMDGYSEEDSSHLQSVINFINAGHYQEAWNLLQTIENRTAFWYYLAGVANSGLGNNIKATEFARQAVQREPNNQEYLQLLQQLQSGGSWYENRSSNYGRSIFPGSLCGRACVSYALCTICSGGGVRFCCI